MNSKIYGSVPLSIIAGIKRDNLTQIQNNIENRFKTNAGKYLRNFIWLSSYDGSRYWHKLINEGIRNIVNKIKIIKSNGLPYPSHISLFYFPSSKEDENQLLVKNFFLFAQCQKLPEVNNDASAIEITNKIYEGVT